MTKKKLKLWRATMKAAQANWDAASTILEFDDWKEWREKIVTYQRTSADFYREARELLTGD